MPNPLTLLGDSLKALATSPHLTFSPTTSGYAPASSWLGSFPAGAKKDYGALVGDPLQNYVIAAAVNAVALALPDAPPFLENLRDGRWVRVDAHPVLDFLRQPHTDLDDADVWSLTSLYRLTRGEAFWIIHLSDAGQPTEAVPYDPRRVRVVGTRDELISGYEVTTEDGRLIPFPKQQVLHFRHLPDPNNPRRGWTPLSTGTRHLVGSNAASTYHTALLLNGAVSSWLISMRDAGQGNVTPEQFQTFIDAMRRKYSGTTESAGGIDGLSIPLEIQRMAYSPDEMAIDKLVDYYEQTLCSLTGVSKKLLDLGADATYLNLREAISDFWERRLVPMRNKDARALTNQLLPLFGLSPTQWRVGFDFSNVPALQENQDALFTRWRELYRAGGCDLYTLQSKIGLPTVPDTYKERFFGQKAGDTQNGEDAANALEAKAVWVESEHPRDKEGKWTSGVGTGHNGKPSAPKNVNSLWRNLSPQQVDKFLPRVPHPFRPQGKEVAAGLNLSPKAREYNLEHVVALIDQVHGDGRLPHLPVNIVSGFANKSKNGGIKQGEFVQNPHTDEPEEIQVFDKADAPELTVLHEIAHYLDFKGLQTETSWNDTFSSHRMHLSKTPNFADSDLRELRNALKKSVSYQTLQKYNKRQKVTGKGGMTYDLDQKYVQYLMEPEELFARAYCQYIATRSGDETLRKQIAATLMPGSLTPIGGKTRDSLKYPEYWDPKDFEPIGQAFDNLFKSKNWLA